MYCLRFLFLACSPLPFFFYFAVSFVFIFVCCVAVAFAGVAYTGSGKTLVFALPMIMSALEQEVRFPLTQNEGPLSLALCPSRELAQQTFDVISFFCNYLHEGGFPRLRPVLLIGGVPVSEQLRVFHRFIAMFFLSFLLSLVFVAFR